MNNMLATETAGEIEARNPVETSEKRPVATQLELWPNNERMRHIPTREWMIWKLDSDVRGRLAKLLPAYSSLAAEDPRRPRIETELKSICRAADRLAEAAKHTRSNGVPSELTNRLTWAIDHAVANLKTIDVATFGKRAPFHLFDRSHAEQIYGALLAVMQGVERLLPLIREVDPDLDERLLDGLVVLANPVDARMLKPIA